MPSTDKEPNTANQRQQRSRLRWAGLIVISVVSVALVLVSTVQILRATIFPPTPPTDFSCREGTRELYHSISIARERAAFRTLPEREALAAFRGDLQPIWNQAPSVRALCDQEKDREALKALRSVELLRYAEERAVRYGSLDLTRVRGLTPTLVDALGPSTKEN